MYPFCFLSGSHRWSNRVLWTPTIKIDAATSTFLASDTTLSVYLDRVQVATVSSYMAALAALVSCYWVFNVELPRSMSCTSVGGTRLCTIHAANAIVDNNNNNLSSSDIFDVNTDVMPLTQNGGALRAPQWNKLHARIAHETTA